MRPNIICSLFAFGGGIVLAILAPKIHDYESWFWVAAAACFVAAVGMLVAPRISSKFLIGSPLQIGFGKGDKYERTEQILETGMFRRLMLGMFAQLGPASALQKQRASRPQGSIARSWFRSEFSRRGPGYSERCAVHRGQCSQRQCQRLLIDKAGG
jgi:hypothetical protein